jgi:hypothetical protein
VDVDAEGIFLEPIGVGRRLHDDGEDRAPALGGGQRVIDVAPLDPFDAEAVVGVSPSYPGRSPPTAVSSREPPTAEMALRSSRPFEI